MPAFGFAPAAGATPATGTALADYRSPLADALGLYDAGLTVAAYGSGPDAARYLILDGLRDDEAARDAWAGGYLYALTSPTGTQMKILSAGAHGRYGAVAVANPPSPAVPVGTPVVLSHPLPIKRYAAIKGIDDLVNEALRSCRVAARISITSDGTRSTSLAAYPFIRSEDDIRALYDASLYGTSDPLAPTASGWRLDLDGVAATLVTDAAYPAGQAYALDVLVAGDRLVYDGTAWGYPSAPGLLSDAHRAAVPPSWVLAFGMVKGLEQLRKLVRRERGLDRAERAARISELDREARIWGGRALRIALTEMPQPAAKPRGGMFGRAYLSAPSPVTTWP